MITDAEGINKESRFEFDICIIGAGAAGITLAREFLNHDMRVCLLESGGLDYHRDCQSLYEGENMGQPYFPLDVCRLRYFGGTTNHWSGTSRPLDDLDFEKRDWIPSSGWPISKRDLTPYYARAHTVLQIPADGYEVARWEKDISPRLPLLEDKVFTSIWLGHALKFGQAYWKELKSAENIHVFLHANLLQIQTNAEATKVTQVQIGTLRKNRFWVKARIFILACGGIENARLLLLSDDVEKKGLGNRHDQVGRFFMEHSSPRLGMLLLSSGKIPTQLYKGSLQDGRWVFGELSLREAVQEEEKILNMGVTFLPSNYEGRLNEGYISFKRILKEFLRGEIAEDFWEDYKNVLRDIDGVVEGAYDRFVAGDKGSQSFVLIVRGEQAPNPLSRITLGERRDILGLRQVRLDWRFTDLDRRSMRRLAEIIGNEFGRARLGRLKMDDWLIMEDPRWHQSASQGRCHHIGTTRMSLKPEGGVVDPSCRLHTVDNLYVAGSSVFPTSGAANPTLTLVALSLRLADHLKERIGLKRGATNAVKNPSYS